VTWIAPDVERSEDYPAGRNEPEREMLRDWLDWHRATLLRKCAGLDATRLARRAVSAAVIAALAGCGSQAHGGTVDPPAMRPACPEGSAFPPGTHGEVDYIDSIRHDSVNYEYLPSVPITASQVGSVVTRIRCSMATYPDTHAPPSHWADDTATGLSAGTPVHAVKGFSPRCRLAAYVAGRPRTYVAVNDTKHGPVPRACAKVQ